MYSSDHIVRIRNLVDRYALPYFDGFASLNVRQLHQMYNGIGPAKFGDAVRGLSTDLFTVFEPAALVHDAACTPKRYGGDNDGTYAGFVCANKHFATACNTIANESRLYFGWFRPQQRDLRRFVGRQLARAVTGDIAWDAYRDAYTASTFGAAA